MLLSQEFSSTYQVQDSYKIYNEAQFALCFECHASYPGVTKEDTLGVKSGGAFDQTVNYNLISIKRQDGSIRPPYYTSGVTTHFVDHIASDSSCSLNNGLAAMNLHWYHLGIDTYFRGQTSVLRGSVCVTCHDVHGSTIQYGAVYEELGYSNGVCGSSSYGEMATKFYHSSELSARPAYCSFNCHVFMDATRAWYFPITEYIPGSPSAQPCCQLMLPDGLFKGTLFRIFSCARRLFPVF